MKRNYLCSLILLIFLLLQSCAKTTDQSEYEEEKLSYENLVYYVSFFYDSRTIKDCKKDYMFELFLQKNGSIWINSVKMSDVSDYTKSGHSVFDDKVFESEYTDAITKVGTLDDQTMEQINFYCKSIDLSSPVDERPDIYNICDPDSKYRYYIYFVVNKKDSLSFFDFYEYQDGYGAKYQSLDQNAIDAYQLIESNEVYKSWLDAMLTEKAEQYFNLKEEP